MQILSAISTVPAVIHWLETTRQPRILHSFDQACNLINEQGVVLSIVSQQIGKGPFNLVVDTCVPFNQVIHAGSSVTHSPHSITIDNIKINTTNASSWDPRPDWELLHARSAGIVSLILESTFARLNLDATKSAELPITNDRSLISSFATVLVNADVSTGKSIATQLAGLGMGLTPSGDDFIMGAIYAAWIIHPYQVAHNLALEIANSAAPLTTSLSAAWLRSAGRGEAGILWHALFEALINSDSTEMEYAIKKILAVGATSGADALAGFIHTLNTYAES